MTDEEKPVEYREIPGFPKYRVGDDGSVWSSFNTRQHRGKTGWQKLSPCVPSNGRGTNWKYAGGPLVTREQLLSRWGCTPGFKGTPGIKGRSK